MPERLVVAVTYDPAVGYRTTGGPELPVVSALSLGGIRRWSFRAGGIFRWRWRGAARCVGYRDDDAWELVSK